MIRFFAHPLSNCESGEVGDGTHISAFATVASGARIGADCHVGESVVIADDVTIGDHVTIRSGARLGAGVRIEDDVTIGHNCVLSVTDADSDDQSEPSHEIVVRVGASLGTAAIVLASVEIGQAASIKPGSMITQSIPAHAIVGGYPATIQGYVNTPIAVAPGSPAKASVPGRTDLHVRGVHIQRFPDFSDLRGKLMVAECPGEGLPFAPARWFMVYEVPSREARGEHAHRVCHQFLVCASGQVSVAVDDGENRAEITLAEPTLGIYIPPLVWASQFRYDSNSVLLAFASHPYDPDDYIRDYGSFLAAIGRADTHT